jgi:hypothetical protein
MTVSSELKKTPVKPKTPQGKQTRERLIKLELVPLRIAEKTPSLEEAFITITQENIDSLARGGRS